MGRGDGPSGGGYRMGQPGRLAGLSLSLPYFFGRKEIEKRKRKRGLGTGVAQGDNFPGLTKMSLIQEKEKWPRLQDVNSNSFELNSNDLNRK